MPRTRPIAHRAAATAQGLAWGQRLGLWLRASWRDVYSACFWGRRCTDLRQASSNCAFSRVLTSLPQAAQPASH